MWREKSVSLRNSWKWMGRYEWNFVSFMFQITKSSLQWPRTRTSCWRAATRPPTLRSRRSHTTAGESVPTHECSFGASADATQTRRAAAQAGRPPVRAPRRSAAAARAVRSRGTLCRVRCRSTGAASAPTRAQSLRPCPLLQHFVLAAQVQYSTCNVSNMLLDQ